MLGVLDVAGLGLVGYCKQVPVFPGEPYAHGVVASVFNSDRYPYFEMETHGPLVRLPPGGRRPLPCHGITTASSGRYALARRTLYCQLRGPTES